MPNMTFPCVNPIQLGPHCKKKSSFQAKFLKIRFTKFREGFKNPSHGYHLQLKGSNNLKVNNSRIDSEHSTLPSRSFIVYVCKLMLRFIKYIFKKNEQMRAEISSDSQA